MSDPSDSDELYLDKKGRIIFVCREENSQWFDEVLHNRESPNEPIDPNLIPVPISTPFIRKLYREGWTAAEFAEIYEMYR